MNIPEFRTGDPSALDRLIITPQFITGYIRQALVYHFSDIRNLMEPSLRKPEYLWKPDDTVNQKISTGILIEVASNYDPEKIGKRPAILLTREPIAVGERMSIGDAYQTPGNLIGNGHDPNKVATMGQKQQVIRLDGGYNLTCVAGSGAAAEILGTEVFHFIVDYQSIIRQELGLDVFRASGLQKVQKLPEYKENWVVPVTLTYSYQRNSLIQQESPLLKAVTMIVNKKG